MIVRSALLAPALLLSAGAFAQTPIRITADLTEAPRKIYHAEIDLPVKPGPATFTTPKWIPGNHRPTGPVSDITGVVFSVNGKPLPWRRDDVDLYAYHVDVPAGTTTLHAHLDCIVSERASDYMAVLEWEKLLLYPANVPVKQIAVQPSVTVPLGWGIGTALQPVGAYDPNAKTGGTVQYQATTVEQLEDSPIIAGEHFHEFALAPEISPKHYLDVVSDEAHDEDLNPETLDAASNLVREASAAYASHHYNVYHFLLTLSDVAGGEGLEHGQSSDNGVNEKSFTTPAGRLAESDLLAHEFTHSWNGKYRRPDKLYQADFAAAEVGELLWVYEGMTQYMGNVLAARSGLETQAQYRDRLAMTAANLDYKSGRLWRSTDDTALAASILRSDGPEWSNWRRGQDYYAEGELLWLDVDTLIRQLTDDKKTIADFHKLFLAKGGNTGPLIVTYNRQELIDDLNQVAPYDWKTFLHERVDNITPHADVAGIERGGYKLEYKPTASKSETMMAQARARRGGGGPSVWYSLGLQVRGDGTVSDVRVGGPADKAKIAPGEKLIGVDGWVYSSDALHNAIVDAAKSTQPIHFIVQSQDKLQEIAVDYHDGERHPVLVRADGSKDYLDEIITPLTQHPPASKPAKADSDADNN